MRILWQDLRGGARMLCKRLGFTLLAGVTFALFCPAAALGQSETPPDQWVGSFERDGVLVPVEMSWAPGASTARVRITYASLAIAGFEAASVTLAEERVELAVVDRTGGRHLFRGRQSEGVITGDYLAPGGSRATSFSLLRLSTTKSINDWVGIYRCEDGALANVSAANRSLVLTDLSDGRVRALFPTGENRFVHGNSLRVPHPVAGTVEFTTLKNRRTMRWHDGARLRLAPEVEVRTEEVQFKNGEITLAGTLLIPPGAGPHPAVVLTHGGGPATRGAGPVPAVLIGAGYAVLMFDKRGTGASSGEWRAPFEAYARDALAGVKFLRTRRDIRAERVGIWGPSQGGWVAPLAATLAPEIAFVIVQAASGVNPIEQELFSLERWLRKLNRYSEPEIAAALSFQRLAYETAATGAWDEYERRRTAARQAGWYNEVSAPPRDSGGHKFWAWNGAFDVLPLVAQLRVPLLAIFGGADDVVPTERSVGPWSNALARGHNANATLIILPTAEHELMLTSPQGPAARTRYATGYFSALDSWLRQLK